VSIAPIAAIASIPLPAVAAPTAATGVAKPDFANVLASGMEKLQGLQDKSDNLAVQAATGDLTDIHDYMIAASEATTATQFTVAMRDKAVGAFTEIMRMQM
jgi:flagellar hook-basal body complex protein FliE